MGRLPRINSGGLVYHVLNRSNLGLTLFRSEGDYSAFIKILHKIRKDIEMRILDYSLMPNHWHLVLWPRHDGDLTTFTRLVEQIHAQKWMVFRRVRGRGHLYQGRFKSFPIFKDEHFIMVCRYVERNALKAGLVERAEDWPWTGLRESLSKPNPTGSMLSAWPVQRSSNWVEIVNKPLTASEYKRLNSCVKKNTPFGPRKWVENLGK